jgi:hypothetical protein
MILAHEKLSEKAEMTLSQQQGACRKVLSSDIVITKYEETYRDIGEGRSDISELRCAND